MRSLFSTSRAAGGILPLLFWLLLMSGPVPGGVRPALAYPVPAVAAPVHIQPADAQAVSPCLLATAPALPVCPDRKEPPGVVHAATSVSVHGFGSVCSLYEEQTAPFVTRARYRIHLALLL